MFAPATDMLEGLEDMLAERRENNRMISPEWEVCLGWLQEYVHKRRVSGDGD